jgi:hypothetical protein
VNKKLLFSVTKNYKKIIEDFAKNNQLSCEYVENGVRKDDFMKKYRQCFEKKEKFGVYYIMKTKENESTFRVVRPAKKTATRITIFQKPENLSLITIFISTITYWRTCVSALPHICLLK